MLLVPGIPILWQAVGFVVLSLHLHRRLPYRHFRQADEHTDQPLLNRRAAQFVGRVFPLESAIVDGHGRLKIGDAFWTVSGPDLPAGTRVRVVASDGMVLSVVAAD